MPIDEQHQHATDSAGSKQVRCAVLTISDTRTTETDQTGPLIQHLLTEAGHTIVEAAIVPDEPAVIAQKIKTWLKNAQVQAILTTGGTGLAHRDRTVEVVRDLITIELEGFGELFRFLSFKEVKAAAMLSRALAGLVEQQDDAGGDTFIFALPGSVNAVRTAVSQLIVPQLPHLIGLRTRK